MYDISDAEILPLSLDHGFWTWAAQRHVQPLAVKSAKGVYFWDVEGKRYLDFNSMVMCANIGHGDERVVQAMARQAGELAFAGPLMATKPRAVLGKQLSQITPAGLSRFLFTLGGADANENAVKLARGYTGRSKILARYRSYHGATYGAIALTGDPRRTAWEPLIMPGVVHFLDPYRYRSTFHRNAPDLQETEFALDYLNHLEEVIQYENPVTIAAILIEPVTGTNGVIIPPSGYLEGVRDICSRHGIVMIVDEVMSGFGRTGKWFAVDHWGVVPDIMTIAKGLTSGYAPLGAVAINEEIAAAFNDRVFEGGLTWNAHPVSLAAASAVIDVIQQDDLVEQAAERGRMMGKLLGWLAERHVCVGETRSIGLFGVIELVRDRRTKEPLAPYNGTSAEMTALRNFLLEKGLFLYTHWHTILLLPPLIITSGQLEEGFEILDQALERVDKTLS